MVRASWEAVIARAISTRVCSSTRSMTREISRTFEYDSRPAWNSVTVRGIEGRARATRTCSRAAPGDIEQAQASQWAVDFRPTNQPDRSEEHTSELQSRGHLVCRLLLEKKKEAEQAAVSGRVGEERYKDGTVVAA